MIARARSAGGVSRRTHFAELIARKLPWQRFVPRWTAFPCARPRCVAGTRPRQPGGARPVDLIGAA